MKKNKIFSWVFIGLIVGIAAYLSAFQSNPVAPDAANQSDAELVDAEGNAVNFEDFKGKVVFVNNWASWCPPCVAEMPSIQKLRETFTEDELSFVMVSFDRNPQVGLKFMERKGFDLPVYFPGRKFPDKFVTDGIPATFVLSPQGEVLFTHVGMTDYASSSFIKKVERWLGK
ncbi:TlpA disulfide reductase family protein [Rapidithrix thailandica]|uniref:TlpA disulfide reductase family protein n=1 Tax=Rapidithrix thailandica TaxID=413964 RepID=A0AAW9SKA9_9BACT